MQSRRNRKRKVESRYLVKRERRRKGMFSEKKRGKTKEETGREKEIEERTICLKTHAAEMTTED